MRSARCQRRRWSLAAGACWLLYLPLLSVGCSVPLVGEAGEVDEAAANQVLLALSEAGIEADKRSTRGGSVAVWVPRGAALRALRVLHERELPRRQKVGLLGVLNQGSSLMPDRADQRLRRAAAMGAELEQALESVTGVVSAHVQLALPISEPRRGQEPAAARASVLLRHAGRQAPLSEAEIRRLAVGSLTGVEAQSVAVVLKQVPAGLSASPVGAVPRETVRIGPITASAASAPWLRGVIAAAAVLNIAMASLLLVVWRRSRQVRA